jgi:hypothetical protein
LLTQRTQRSERKIGCWRLENGLLTQRTEKKIDCWRLGNGLLTPSSPRTGSPDRVGAGTGRRRGQGSKEGHD